MSGEANAFGRWMQAHLDGVESALSLWVDAGAPAGLATAAGRFGISGSGAGAAISGMAGGVATGGAGS
jgi:hypothetical protein